MPKKKPRRRRPAQASAAPEILNTLQHPDAAGIDIGASELVVAVPPGRATPAVRTFSSFTQGVYEVRAWLLACGIKTVALESTGNYWITLYAVLEEAGLEVCLVNAQHVKGVPGRKTDVCDAQWLQQLHQAGLLRRSFRPGPAVTPLRYVMRHRASLVRDASRKLLQMQKVLTEMNLKLHHVFSELDGESAQRIITAILDGQRDKMALAQLRDRRCRAPLERVLQALEGDYRPELLFVLRQLQQQRAQIVQAMADCDAQLAQLCAAVPSAEREPTPAEAAPSEGAPPPPRAGKKRKTGGRKDGPAFAVREEAIRFYGVDLSGIDGVGPNTLAVLMSEVGPRAQLLKSFSSAEKWTGWTALCPNTRITGGKVLSSQTRQVHNRVAQALRLAAQTLLHSKSELGRFTLRMCGRLGKAEGLTAAAHKLARLIYAMIVHQTSYDEKIAFQITPAKQARKLQNLMKQAADLGLQLVAAT